MLVVLVLLVLVAAMGLRSLTVDLNPGAGPTLVANGPCPVPPTPWKNGPGPVPPTPWKNGPGPVPPTPWNK